MPHRRVANRLALLLAAAALVPVVAFGAWSLVTLRRSTRESVVASNLSVPVRAANNVGRAAAGAAAPLKAPGADLPPVSQLAAPLGRPETPGGWLVVVVRLEEAWHIVDRLWPRATSARESSRASLQQTVEAELDTLRRLMDDALNVARPRRALERRQVDTNSAVSEVVGAIRTEGNHSDVSVSGRYAAGAAVIDGDRFALSRVFRNLIASVIQATAPGGSMSVTTARVGDTVEIRVVDTGAGIPADRLAAIFEDFITTRRRGPGSGLATSRRIVEQLGGSIAVASEVGSGATFTLRFPASAERETEAAS